LGRLRYKIEEELTFKHPAVLFKICNDLRFELDRSTVIVVFEILIHFEMIVEALKMMFESDIFINESEMRSVEVRFN